MKYILTVLLFAILVSCNNNNAPDVSKVKITLQVDRFEKDFFAIDTNQIGLSLHKLSGKYGLFLNDYLVNILGIPFLPGKDTNAENAIKRFIADYQSVKDTANKVFQNFDKITDDVKKGLQYVGYYFPQYKQPEKLITFIGPLDAHFQGSLGGYGDIITTQGLAVGLQLHLGKNYSLYQSELGQQLYPGYVSRRFEPEYISVNCMKNIIDDLFPEKASDKPMIEQMIEKGKRLYVLDKLLPFVDDTLKIGYTSKQLQGCYEHEADIWNLFLQNNLLYNIDPSIQKNYLQDGPKTEELGDASPGFIGLFTGRQIVRKYMEKHGNISLTELMSTDSRKIFEEAKYKPR